MSYLQLPCSVESSRYESSLTVFHQFVADIFGISPVNELGYRRYVGQFDETYYYPAVFWIVRINCSRHCVLRSNYESTLLDVSDSECSEIISYRFSVHPVPIHELHECRRFPPPQITAIIDDSEIEMYLGIPNSSVNWDPDVRGIAAAVWLPK